MSQIRVQNVYNSQKERPLYVRELQAPIRVNIDSSGFVATILIKAFILKTNYILFAI